MNSKQSTSDSTSRPSGHQVDGSPLVLCTGTRAKLKPPAQRQSVISLRRITEFDVFLMITWTYVLKSILYIYESFKVRVHQQVYSRNEKFSHLPSRQKCRKKVEILKHKTIKKFEAIDIRLNELAEWGPGWRFLRSFSVDFNLGSKPEGLEFRIQNLESIESRI